MTYPTLSAAIAQEVADLIMAAPKKSQLSVDISENQFVVLKDGFDYDRVRIEKSSAAVQRSWEEKFSEKKKRTDDDLYLFEIKFAGQIYEIIESCHIDLREDKDFWRYLALFPFRWYLLAREAQDNEFKPQDFGGLTVVSQKKDPRDPDYVVKKKEAVFQGHLIYRTYLIGKAMYDEENAADPFARRGAIDLGDPVTDIWQSHIIRVKIGRIGKIAHAFVDKVSSYKPPFDMKESARKLAKGVTRIKNNVLYDEHSKTEIDKLMNEQESLVKAKSKS